MEKRPLIIQAHGGALRPLQKGETANPNGRPKSELTKIREELQLKHNFKISKHDTRKLLDSLIFGSKEELEAMFKNAHVPASIKNVIAAIFADTKNGVFNTSKYLMEREFGKNDIKKAETVTNNFNIRLPADLMNESIQNMIGANIIKDVTPVEKKEIDELI